MSLVEELLRCASAEEAARLVAREPSAARRANLLKDERVLSSPMLVEALAGAGAANTRAVNALWSLMAKQRQNSETLEKSLQLLCGALRVQADALIPRAVAERNVYAVWAIVMSEGVCEPLGADASEKLHDAAKGNQFYHRLLHDLAENNVVSKIGLN